MLFPRRARLTDLLSRTCWDTLTRLLRPADARSPAGIAFAFAGSSEPAVAPPPGINGVDASETPRVLKMSSCSGTACKVDILSGLSFRLIASGVPGLGRLRSVSLPFGVASFCEMDRSRSTTILPALRRLSGSSFSPSGLGLFSPLRPGVRPATRASETGSTGTGRGGGAYIDELEGARVNEREFEREKEVDFRRKGGGGRLGPLSGKKRGAERGQRSPLALRAKRHTSWQWLSWPNLLLARRWRGRFPAPNKEFKGRRIAFGQPLTEYQDRRGVAIIWITLAFRPLSQMDHLPMVSSPKPMTTAVNVLPCADKFGCRQSNEVK